METENTQEKKMTLVLGGTSKTGRRVAERLKARGMPTQVGTRSGEPPFDWEDRSTWAPALQNAESVYVSYYPDLAIPGAPEAVRAFAELAVQNGVRRLVLLSGRGEEEAQSAEQALREVGEEAGVEWTIVRCSWFMQNFDENYLLEPILGGEVALPSLTDGAGAPSAASPRTSPTTRGTPPQPASGARLLRGTSGSRR